MSDERRPQGADPTPPHAGPDALAGPDDLEGVEPFEDPALRALLKRSLGAADDEGASGATLRSTRSEQGALLRGVQRKLRTRSKGKFYADGWSTTHSRVNYALVAAVMLMIIAAVYVVLGPMGISLR